MTQSHQPDYFFWLDLEMTGLNIAVDTIIEIASVITDVQLNVVAVGPELAIQTSAQQLAAMDEWCTRTHNESGLVQRCLDSSVTLAQAEKATMEFVSSYLAPSVAPLCGNSIGTDRTYLKKYMPDLESYMSYRNLDVTSIRITRNMWGKEVCPSYVKKNSHRALEDIYESINELRHYKKHFLISQ